MDSDLENEEPLLLFRENGKRKTEHDDILDLDSTKVTKKQRTLSSRQEENGEDLIFRTENENEEQPSMISRVSYRRVLRHIPHDIPYIPVTTESGSRVYLRILKQNKDMYEDQDDDDAPLKLISTEGGSNRKLFSDWDKIKNDARVLKDKFHNSLGNIVENENIIEGLGLDKKLLEDSLWVEKYKPRGYMDLLSEEKTNKMLLHWLKLWDKSVFGNDYLSKVKLTKEKYAKLEAKEKEKFEKENKYQSKSNQAVIFDDDYDSMGRPKLKVALLFGPPGLGKTTCAHIVAKHAGYSVREMNASDDRSMEFFRKVLDDALESRSEIFHDGKPNCLIIDEIDGAPLATVNILVELISGNATEKGKKKIKKVLKRPIICICNDLYAPSLKDLKKHALVLQFNPVTIPSLAERLREISSREHLHLDNGTIQSLCEKSECDIRSCLSTLQFLKKKKCTPKDALFSLVGMKDKSKGLFPVWSDIFTVPDGRKKHSEDVDNSKPDVRFKSVMRVVQSFGEYEKLIGGVFENYLRIKFKDCYFESILEGLSWANWFHDMSSTITHSQNYVLMGYLPTYFVACHFLYAQRSRFKIQFPSNEAQNKIPRCRTIIANILSETIPSVGRFVDPFDAVADLFPFIITVIQPSTIRPVPTQIWSARERETLRNIVEIMITYNLSYTQMKSPETGAYNFILEPDIGALAKFKVQEIQGSKRTFPYAVKQFVAREIETEKMRRSDSEEIILRSQISTDKASTQVSQKPEDSQKPEFKVPPKPVISAPKIKADPMTMMAKDFFGRTVALSAQSTKDLLAQQRRATGIYFKFKEGYSNAVRRFVKMKDLE